MRSRLWIGVLVALAASTGPGGTVTQHVDIKVLERAVNSAPVCDPVQTAQRSDGGGPVELTFYISCGTGSTTP